MAAKSGRGPAPRRGSRAADLGSGSGAPSRTTILGLGAIVVVALVAGFFALRSGATSGDRAPSAANGTCPTSQPSALGAGQTRTVTMATEKGTIVIKLVADLSPVAVGNFAALVTCGFYDGIGFHRTATLADGTPFVIQGGDPTGKGGGGPGYTITDEPVTAKYGRGTVAMARNKNANSVGSQFFIVLDDKDRTILESANTYQIIGTVTSGMDVADSIYAASNGEELPAKPVKMTHVTIATP